MLLVGDEWDFIAARNDSRVVTNLASLCPPPGAEHAVPLVLFDENISGTASGRSLSQETAEGCELETGRQLSPAK